MARAILVETPSDFERSMDFHDFVLSPLITPNPQVEPAFRDTLNSIFDDLPYISSERDMVAAYLRSIEEPLKELHSLGCVIFAISTKGKMKGNDSETRDWKRVYYLVVPTRSFFRIGKELSNTVHCFNPNCEDGVTELVKAAIAEMSVAIWPDKSMIVRELEGNVPWCVECC